MEIGCEIKALQSIHINPESYVETTLIVDGEEITDSQGIDNYLFHATIIPGHRFTGTGRQASYNLDKLPAGLGVFDAAACKKVNIPVGKEFKLKLKSNFLLDYHRLPYQLNLFVLYNSKHKEIDLRRPDIGIRWVRRGEFMIDLTAVTNQCASWVREM